MMECRKIDDGMNALGAPEPQGNTSRIVVQRDPTLWYMGAGVSLYQETTSLITGGKLIDDRSSGPAEALLLHGRLSPLVFTIGFFHSSRSFSSLAVQPQHPPLYRTSTLGRQP